MRHGTRGDQVENGLKRQPGIKWQSGIKMAEKGPKNFSRFMRHFPTTSSIVYIIFVWCVNMILFLMAYIRIN